MGNQPSTFDFPDCPYDFNQSRPVITGVGAGRENRCFGARSKFYDNTVAYTCTTTKVEEGAREAAPMQRLDTFLDFDIDNEAEATFVERAAPDSRTRTHCTAQTYKNNLTSDAFFYNNALERASVDVDGQKAYACHQDPNNYGRYYCRDHKKYPNKVYTNCELTTGNEFKCPGSTMSTKNYNKTMATYPGVLEWTKNFNV